MTVRRFGPIGVAEMSTDAGVQAMMRALFPELPQLHAITAEQFKAIGECATPEAEWLGRFPLRAENPNG